MTEPGHKPSNWNVPNALTTLRIVMVPFFGWALLTAGGESIGWRLVAFTIFGLAMLTDKIDGDLARKHNLITDFGKIADPMADKAITGMAFIGLSVIGELWWWVTILVLLREWSVTIMRLSVAKHVVIAANSGGKIKTVLQTVALGGLILPLRQIEEIYDGPIGTIALVVRVVSLVVLAAAVAMTLYTGVGFFKDAFKQRRDHKAAASV